MLGFKKKDKRQTPSTFSHSIRGQDDSRKQKPIEGHEAFKSGLQYYQEKEYTKALLSLEKAADKGHGDAQSQLGYMHQNGLGVPVDNQLAMEWYMKAVENKNNAAKSSIGFLYHYGVGVAVDYRRAMEWYIAADNTGDSNAQYGIACLYQQGLGVTLDYAKAMEWFLKSANNGNNPAAQCQLGFLYEKGLGMTEPHVLSAIEWYSKSASQGYAIAQFNLAYLYEHDSKIKNLNDAVDWYYKASQSGDKTAMLAVERLTREGYYPKNDLEKVQQEPSLSRENDSKIRQGARQLGNHVKRFESLLNDNVGIYKEKKEGIILGYKKLELAKDEIVSTFQNPQNNVTKTVSRIFSKKEPKNKPMNSIKADDTSSQNSDALNSTCDGYTKNNGNSFHYHAKANENDSSTGNAPKIFNSGDYNAVISKPDEKDGHDTLSLPMLKPDDVVNHKPDQVINTKPDEIDYPSKEIVTNNDNTLTEKNSHKLDVAKMEPAQANHSESYSSKYRAQKYHGQSRANDLYYDSSENDDPENDLNYDSPDENEHTTNKS